MNLIGCLRNLLGLLGLSLAPANTVLIEDGKKILVDPGARELGSWGVLESRLKELGLTPNDIDIVVNTHLHSDHAGSNFIFRGKKLIVHEKELLSSSKHSWPEFREACVKALRTEKISGDTKLTEDVKVLTTPGHTIGSLSVTVDTPNGLVAIVGDAFSSKEEYLNRKISGAWVEDKETSLKSIDKLRKLSPKTIIPGHSSPFSI